MPVTPAPTTSTSTSVSGGGVIVADCTDRLVVSSLHDHRGSGARDRGAVRGGDAGPDPEGALRRRRVPPARGRAPLVARLADGVPARGDPGAGRRRRVRLRRPVGDR